MANLSDAQIAQVAGNAGFKGNNLVTAIAICLAESGGNTAAQGLNRNSKGQVISVDRGLWQINSVAHAEISDSCAYQAACNAQAAFKISSGGANWSPWSTFKSQNNQLPAYLQYISRAQTAAGNAPSGSSTGSPPSTTPPAAGGSATELAFTSNLAFSTVANDTASYQTLGAGSDVMAAYRLILAIAIMAAALYLIAKSTVGYVAIYYVQCLILFFLFVTQFTFFKQALSPLQALTQPSGQ